MPKIKLGLNAQDKAALDKAADENSFARYDGDIPPNGLYKAVIKTVNYMLSKEKQAPQLRAVVEIKEPAGSEKAEFNGYALFHYITLPVDPSYEYYGLQSAQTKEFLCALAGGDDAAWKGYKDDNMVGDESKTMKVTKFGTYSHNHKVGSPVKIMIEQDGEYKGQPNMRIKQFGLIKGAKAEVAASVEEPESIPLVEDDEPPTKPELKEEPKREDVEPAAVETEAPVDTGDDATDESPAAGEQRDEAASDDSGSSDSGDAASEAAPRRRRRRFADA
ncbi:hypothetical protein SEA_CHEWYVIII_76 [Rhodococcus phage ChewyVIII]|uniref:Uncharacterized protein n=1 Tax=Rhodococcus phage ChewyVIII TaxID=1887657 RepID=A0A1C9EI93_9CAUD|nr:hypothetical protein QEH30_gp76 [Rhodococcus phage ChewyVIII]AON97497.1 hypothetical protein SEA_CHEWYVIII_76 [Rhodococcus phage ChewyVIII]